MFYDLEVTSSSCRNIILHKVYDKFGVHQVMKKSGPSLDLVQTQEVNAPEMLFVE